MTKMDFKDAWYWWLFLIRWVVLFIILIIGYLLIGDDVKSMMENAHETWNIRSKPVTHFPIVKTARVKDGIDLATGLAYSPGIETVKKACLACHSAKLITQNKSTREGWAGMIDWMQATQGLPSLGKSEEIILNYLAENYGPVETGRRSILDQEQIEWYVLSLENRR